PSAAPRAGLRPRPRPQGDHRPGGALLPRPGGRRRARARSAGPAVPDGDHRSLRRGAGGDRGDRRDDQRRGGDARRDGRALPPQDWLRHPGRYPRPPRDPRGVLPPRQAAARIGTRPAGAVRVSGVHDIGRMLVVFGLLIALVGVVLMLVGRVPWLGRLPGDIHIQRGNWTFYFPLATSLLLSVVLTLILWILGRR